MKKAAAEHKKEHKSEKEKRIQHWKRTLALLIGKLHEHDVVHVARTPPHLRSSRLRRGVRHAQEVVQVVRTHCLLPAPVAVIVTTIPHLLQNLVTQALLPVLRMLRSRHRPRDRHSGIRAIPSLRAIHHSHCTVKKTRHEMAHNGHERLRVQLLNGDAAQRQHVIPVNNGVVKQLKLEARIHRLRQRQMRKGVQAGLKTGMLLQGNDAGQ